MISRLIANGIRKTHGSDEGTANERYHIPIKCQNAHTQTRHGSEQAIDDNVSRGNPADPAEHAETGEEIPRYKVPDEARQDHEQEEAFATHVARILFTVVLVQGVEKGCVNQSTRPDHARRPYNELT